MAGDGVKILVVISLLFIGMYVYAISSNLIDDAKEMRTLKKKLKKEKKIRKERVHKDEIRAEKSRLIEKRSAEIKRQFRWLEKLNQKIKNKADHSQEKTSQDQKNTKSESYEHS